MFSNPESSLIFTLMIPSNYLSRQKFLGDRDCALFQTETVMVRLCLLHWRQSREVLMRQWQVCLPDTALFKMAVRLSLEKKRAVHYVLLGLSDEQCAMKDAPTSLTDSLLISGRLHGPCHGLQSALRHSFDCIVRMLAASHR